MRAEKGTICVFSFTRCVQPRSKWLTSPTLPCFQLRGEVVRLCRWLAADVNGTRPMFESLEKVGLSLKGASSTSLLCNPRISGRTGRVEERVLHLRCSERVRRARLSAVRPGRRARLGPGRRRSPEGPRSAGIGRETDDSVQWDAVCRRSRAKGNDERWFHAR